MAAWTSSNGIEINIEPFMSEGWKFTQLKMTEIIGGSLAEGSISFEGDGSDRSLALVTGTTMVSHIEITMKKKEGSQYDILGFITSRNWTLNALDINFVCVPDRRFFSEPKVMTQTDITSALHQLWPWDNIDIRCNSDIDDNIPLQQLGESNYSLCKKLAMSYKKNAIFAFGVEKFMIKDLVGIDSFGNEEPHELILGDGQVVQGSSYGMHYNYKLYKQTEDPWVEDDYSLAKVSKNVTALCVNDEYYLVSRDHWNLLSNYTHNTHLMKSRLFTSFNIITVNDLPDFRIGDTVRYKRSTEETTNPFTIFTISKMVYFISTEGSETDENGHNFSVTSVLRGIEEDKVIMPTDESRFDG